MGGRILRELNVGAQYSALGLSPPSSRQVKPVSSTGVIVTVIYIGMKPSAILGPHPARKLGQGSR